MTNYMDYPQPPTTGMTTGMTTIQKSWVIIVLVVVSLLFIYDTATVASLQYDHTTLCNTLAQTPGINYANTGCA